MTAPSAVASPPWTCSSGYVCLFDGNNGVEGSPSAMVAANRDVNLGTLNPPRNDQANSQPRRPSGDLLTS